MLAGASIDRSPAIWSAALLAAQDRFSHAAIAGQDNTAGAGFQFGVPFGVSAGVAQRGDSNDSRLSMIPFGEHWVAITHRDTGAVSVYSANVSPGEQVEGSIAEKETQCHTDDLGTDLSRLFDGVIERSAWYDECARVRVRVQVRIGAEYFGVIERKGRLEPLEHSPAQSTAPGVRTFCVLRHAASERRTHGIERALATNGRNAYGSSLLSLRTVLARVGVPGRPLGWMRVGTRRDARVTDAIRNEAELFRALHDAALATDIADGMHLRPLCTVSDVLGSDEVPCYRAPLALSPGYHEWVVELVTESARRAVDLIVALARIYTALQSLRWSLGLWHPDAFAYGVTANTASLDSLSIVPVLVYAPRARRWGERYTSPSGAVRDRPLFQRLPFDPLGGRVADGAEVDAASDGTSLALCMLELLCRRRIADSPYDSAAELAAGVRGSANAFAMPSLAKWIAKTIASSDGHQSLVAWYAEVAKRRPPDEETLLALVG